MPPVGVLRPEASPIIPSAMDVLPLPRCPIRHTFLMVSVSTATDTSFHEPTPSSPRSGHVAYRRKARRAGPDSPIKAHRVASSMWLILSSTHAPTSSSRKDLRRAAVQAAFETVGQVDQGQADRQVDERRRDQGRPVEGLGLQNPRRPQELGESYYRDEGGVLHQCHELVGQGWYRPPEGLGHDNVAHRLGVGEAGGASGLHLPLVDALDAGAEDLCDVGRAVQAERHQPGEEQALEPDADRGGREVDDGYLHQKRRPPEHVYVDLGGPAQYPRAADLEQREHEAKDYPENLRQEGERDRYEHALQDRVEIVEDYLEVQVVGLQSLEVEAARVELDRHR